MATAGAVIVPSHYLKQMVKGWSYPEEAIYVVYNGVELPQNLPQPAERARGEQLKLIFVGRLTNWKGVETLLLAMVDIQGVTLDIYGTGPEFPMLTELARQLNLTDIRDAKVAFHGAIPKEEVPLRIAQSDCLVLPSSYEGLSHALLEAGASGVPCIATDCGGNSEVITEKENGLLVPYGSPRALSDAICFMRDNKKSRVAMGHNGKLKLKKFSFSTTVEQTIKILIGTESKCP
jgi:glycosyltransferase involved in cell wall biosynthesis